ncbi:hypothetical protein [Dyella sp.]|uniref:hypothetical protein n=1 Tax=Dyella sp. TaxID=1869338 RepID=UPI002B4A71B8|nr:hypothetical protein [Dyella sp.]HKT28101.1 hypothetical protein [Dyella sp.]
MPKKKSSGSTKFSVECQGRTGAGKKVRVTAAKGLTIYKGIKADGALTNHDHAEMQVLESMSPAERNGCTLTQNAYPCSQCKLILKHLSTTAGGGATITVIVDGTKYWEDHTAELSAATIAKETAPVTITYAAGHATYVAG